VVKNIRGAEAPGRPLLRADTDEMESPSSRQSHASLISLSPEDGEPVVMQKTNDQDLGPSGPNPASRDENMAPQPSRAVRHDGAITKNSSSRPARGRQNSLRHVKNSTDVLRQRSLKDRRMEATDGNPGGREGRQFTVGNVGNNGLIYLR
jgi:hypothetical protein